MTIERAIQIMSNYDLNFHEVNEKLFDYGEVAEAFDLAIKALEAPPNDNWECYSGRLWKSAYERGKADAEAEQGWIPVSERLPEMDTTNGCKASDVILVCLMDRTRHMGFYCDDAKWRFCESGEEREPFWEDVIAWMPLPEPYKAESEE